MRNTRTAAAAINHCTNSCKVGPLDAAGIKKQLSGADSIPWAREGVLAMRVDGRGHHLSKSRQPPAAVPRFLHDLTHITYVFEQPNNTSIENPPPANTP